MTPAGPELPSRAVHIERNNYGPITTGDHSPIYFERRGPQRWADTLARQVRKAEQSTWRRLLGDDTRRINLGYRRIETPGRLAENAGALGQMLSAEVDIPDITAYYRALSPRRLVISGAPGSGKTLLALELMLALIDERGPDDPVPVRIALNDWDTQVPLLERMVHQLVHGFGWSKHRARMLVDDGYVLPVLDGLDEMDPIGQGPGPLRSLPRARAAVALLNRHQSGREAGPLVLTVRSDVYGQLREGGPSDEARLFDSAEVTVMPVPPDEAVRYLEGRAIDPPRWSGLLRHLAENPTSPLAQLLSTPWRLCLLATAYSTSGDPSRLRRRRTVGNLDQHLISRYLQVAIKQVSDKRYQARDCRRWLHFIGESVQRQRRSPRASGVILLDQLWRIQGEEKVRNARLIYLILTSIVLGGIGGAVPDHGVLFAALTLMLPLTLCTPLLPEEMATRLAFALGPAGRKLGRLRFTVTAVVTVFLIMAPALVIGDAEGGLERLGTAAVIWTLLARLSTRTRGQIRQPSAIVSDDLARSVMLGIVTGAVVAVANRQDIGWVMATIDGAIVAVFVSVFGIGVVWQRYTLVRILNRENLPFRLQRFLDACVDAGVLRLVGPGYEFRHQELEIYLATHSDASSSASDVEPPV